MSAKKSQSIFESQGWKIGMKYLYGIGASVVIVGALFKILHLPGANEMLIVGLGTEAVIFFFSAFEPLPHEEAHYDWAKVYPQLNEEVDEDELPVSAIAGGGGGAQLPGLDPKALEAMSNNFTVELWENLGTSVKGLKNNVENLADITDATVATNEFASKVKQAASKIDDVSKSFGVTVEAAGSLASSVNDVKAYQEKVKAATKGLESLTAVYEMELQDSQKHIGAINKFYGGVSTAMQSMVETAKDTEALRGEVTKLAKNLQSLNTVYGGMLSAMASGSK